MIRGVIFDLGNTLMYWDVDGEENDKRAGRALVAFLKDNGIEVDDTFSSIFQEHRAKGWKLAEETEIERTIEEALIGALNQLGHTPLDGLAQRAIERYFAEGEVYWHSYPEAVQTLHALRARGLQVGLISNADDDALVQRAVVTLGMHPYLDPIVSSAGLRWRKPNPAIFHHVADLWQLPPAEIVMVGDAPRYDIVGAHRAGMRGVLIDRGEGHAWQEIPAASAGDPAIQPDATVGNLKELLDAITRM